ncbi:MAG: hypothetical protein ACM3US_09855 [Sphingomonadaceae bacterium]
MRYEVMREERLDRDLGAFRPAILWVWDRDGGAGRGAILLRPVEGCEAAAAEYNERISWATGRGHSPRAIWEYFGRDEGDQYFVRRTSPEAVQYADLEELYRVEGAILEGKPLPHRDAPTKASDGSLAALFDELLSDLEEAEAFIIGERSTSVRSDTAELKARLETYRRRFEETRRRMDGMKPDADQNPQFLETTLGKVFHLPGKHDQKGHGKRRAPVESITVGQSGKQKVGQMPDLKGWYPDGEPGRDHLRPLRVMVTKERVAHIVNNPKDGPLRAKLLAEKPHLIRRAIESPELGRRHLDLARSGHWRQTLAVRDPEDPKHYVVVALSLAGLPGQKCSKEHRIITVYLSGEREFYQKGQVRREWKELGTTKPAQ